jgi:cell division protein CrgA
MSPPIPSREAAPRGVISATSAAGPSHYDGGYLTTLAVEHYSSPVTVAGWSSARAWRMIVRRDIRLDDPPLWQESTVPKSQVRKKKVYTAPSDIRPQSTAAMRRPSPVWVPALAVTLIVLGIAWLVVFYLSSGTLPVASWGFWNLAVGFSGMISALIILSRWR